MARESGAARIEEYLGPAGAAYGIIKPIVEFLAHPLDAVTGDPEQLRSKAEAWRQAADQVEGFAQQEQVARQGLLAYWEGGAAQAFNTELAEINQCLKEMATHFDSTAELLDNSAEGAQQAQELVEDIVKELIIWLIGTIIIALASAWITAGLSVAAGAAAGAVEAGVAGTRAAQVGLKLANLLRKVAEFLKKMSEFAKMYKITKIRSVGVSQWMGARFTTAAGGQLIATNWVLKQPLNPAIEAGVNAVAD